MRDRQCLADKNERTNQDQKSMKDSIEVYILKNASWVLLLNPNKWTYHEPRYNHRLQRNMDTYSWEAEFLALDDDFKAIRDLKDLYEEFNESFTNNLEGASKRLDELIKIYHDCDISLFHGFSSLLKRYHDSIVASFTYIPSDKMTDTALRRLSNGPLESFNNIPSSLRSQSRGIHNFRYTRNRILWSVREDAPIKGIPYTADQVRTPGKKRGSYIKKKKEVR